MMWQKAIWNCVAVIAVYAVNVGYADINHVTPEGASLSGEKAKIKELQEMADTYKDMYLSEHSKVFGLEQSLEELKRKYVPMEKLREQLAFYQAASATNSYILAQSSNEWHISIICYGSGVAGDVSCHDVDTKFYKKAHIVSKVHFEPLRLYRVTNGEETRWLAYTPPDKAVIIGGIPYPVEEAHGGDWVELKIDEFKSSPDYKGGDIVVYCYMASDGKVHVGMKVPDNALSRIVIARWSVGDGDENGHRRN